MQIIPWNIFLLHCVQQEIQYFHNLEIFFTIKNNYAKNWFSIEQKILIIQGVQTGDIATCVFAVFRSYLLKDSSQN